jgi:hypothetical protein
MKKGPRPELEKGRVELLAIRREIQNALPRGGEDTHPVGGHQRGRQIPVRRIADAGYVVKLHLQIIEIKCLVIPRRRLRRSSLWSVCLIRLLAGGQGRHGWDAAGRFDGELVNLLPLTAVP